MDNPEEFRSIELCAGYAGIHLGLERVIKSLRTVAFVEIEAFACANLVAKMEAGHLDAAPIWTDLKTFNAKPFRDRIHLITGGYPCQPFSAAGKRLGADDPRHLWPYIYKIVETIRPVLCFFENVEGHLSLGFKEVQQSLRDLGYAVEAGIFSAAECGAPQQRKRLFILAYRQRWENNGERGTDELRRNTLGRQTKTTQCVNGEPGSDSVDRCGEELADDQRERGKELDGQIPTTSKHYTPRNGCNAELGNSESNNKWGMSISAMHREGFTPRGSSWPSRPGEQQHEWEPPRVVANSVSLREPQPEGSKQNERGRTVNEGEELAHDIGREFQRRPRMRISGGNRKQKEVDGMLPGGEGYGSRQIKSAVGRNIDGCPDWLDYAELYESCDNRTDELRLLGNGVMPDAAEKAFITLLEKINENQKA